MMPEEINNSETLDGVIKIMSDTREELRKLIAERAYIEEGHFRTPSGIITDHFDFFKISLKHQGIKLAGELVYNEIKDLQICALGGPGHPISSVLCRAAFLKEIGVFYIRDSMRKEGNIQEPKWIESRIKSGDRVALVGDVVATGSQLIRALEEVIQFGAYIVKIIIIIDSGDGNGVENILNFAKLNQMDNCPVIALYTRDDILGDVHE
jgi:orotate phosphoribosyltransferase